MPSRWNRITCSGEPVTRFALSLSVGLIRTLMGEPLGAFGARAIMTAFCEVLVTIVPQR